MRGERLGSVVVLLICLVVMLGIVGAGTLAEREHRAGVTSGADRITKGGVR